MIRVAPPHPSALLQQAHALRHAGSLCDVVFLLEGRTFRAHRLVLACSCPALAAQLLEREAPGPGLLLREAQDPRRPLRCALDLCSPRTFQQVLDYSYGQALALAPGELCPLRSAAVLLGMRGLEEQCRGLLESLDPSRTQRRTKASDLTRAPEEAQEEWRAMAHWRPEAPRLLEEAAPRRLSPRKEEVETGRPATSPPPPPEKRARTPSTSPYTRDSVIRASTPPRPPWTSPVVHLHPLALRRVAQQYSSLVALRSLDRPQGRHHGQPPTRASSPGRADCAQAEHRRPPSPPAGLEDDVRPDLSARVSETRGSNTATRYMRRVLHAPQVLVDPRPAEKCSPPSGHAPPRSRPDADGEGRGPGAKPYPCLQCPKRFSLKHQLETHHRVHTGEKPFECRLCGQRSRDYSAMIKHLRTHGGAGPYRCTACRDSCSSLAAMQRHVEQHAARDFPPDWSIRRTYLYTSHV